MHRVLVTWFALLIALGSPLTVRPAAAGADGASVHDATIAELRSEILRLTAPRKFAAALDTLRSGLGPATTELQWDELHNPDTVNNACYRPGESIGVSMAKAFFSGLGGAAAPAPTLPPDVATGDCWLQHHHVYARYDVPADCSIPQGTRRDAAGSRQVVMYPWKVNTDELTVYDVQLTVNDPAKQDITRFGGASVASRDATAPPGNAYVFATLNDDAAAGDVAQALNTLIEVCSMTGGKAPG